MKKADLVVAIYLLAAVLFFIVPIQRGKVNVRFTGKDNGKIEKTGI